MLVTQTGPRTRGNMAVVREIAKNLMAVECNDRLGRRGEAKGHDNAEGRQQ
jgi:hypothetical protein